MKMRRVLNLLPMLALLALSHPLTASACSICYGEPDSPVSRGLTWAITALAAIVMAVLGVVVAFFIFMNRRAAAQMSEAVAANPELAVRS